MGHPSLSCPRIAISWALDIGALGGVGESLLGLAVENTAGLQGKWQTNWASALAQANVVFLFPPAWCKSTFGHPLGVPPTTLEMIPRGSLDLRGSMYLAPLLSDLSFSGTLGEEFYFTGIISRAAPFASC